jgi:prepilin-type N-terminal cleavage/methylation domain-containing protein
MRSTWNINFSKLGASARGFTLTEVLVSSGILLVLFMGVFPLVAVTSKNTTKDRNRILAMNEAQKKLEWVRNVDYDTVGAEADATGHGYVETNLENPGYTPGVDPLLSDTVQLSTGVVATRTIYVLWVDDPADGIGAADTDKNTHDYKHIIVQVSWKEENRPHSIILRTFLEGQSFLDLGGGDFDDTGMTKAAKPKADKVGTGKMGMGAKSKTDPNTSTTE